MRRTIISALAGASIVSAVIVIPDPNNPPHQVAAQNGQIGYNDCQKYKDSPSSLCQTVYFNNFDDFCVFAPPKPNSVIGDTEGEQVTWCTKAGHGARIIPSGTFKALHWLQTADYWQISAEGDFTKINVKYGDEGGELDPHGATNQGNPVGGLVLGKVNGNYIQFQEWHEFIAYNELSLRACFHSTGKDTYYCPHIYDEMGSQWNDPGNYDNGFSSCQGDPVAPAYIYKGSNGQTTTFHQGDSYTPPGPAPGKSYSCTKYQSYSYTTYAATTKKATATTHTTTTSANAKPRRANEKRRVEPEL